jgi:hypothetical protein
MAHKDSKTPKHPKDMTTEEAVKHLFHPKVVKHLKKQVKKGKESK